jgi:hypothetical protein
MADRLRELAAEFRTQACALQQEGNVPPEAPNASPASAYKQQRDD